MKECERAADVRRILRKQYNCFAEALTGSYYQRPGLPDTFILHKGVVLFVEFKGAETVIRPLQNRVLEEIRQHGGNSFTVRFVSVKQWLVNETYEINFAKLSDGVGLLLTTLLELSERRGNLTATLLSS